jgi:hypothetical protein
MNDTGAAAERKRSGLPRHTPYLLNHSHNTPLHLAKFHNPRQADPVDQTVLDRGIKDLDTPIRKAEQTQSPLNPRVHA